MRNGKKIVNVLRNWKEYRHYADHRIRGKAMLNQEAAGAETGDYIITSPVVSMFEEDGVQYAETRNSIYALIEKDE
jgi:hypothetical protein